MFQNAKGTDFFMEERNKALKGVLGSSTQRAWEISSKCFDDLCDMRTALSKSVKRLASRWRERSSAPHTAEGIRQAACALRQIPKVYAVRAEGERRIREAATVYLSGEVVRCGQAVAITDSECITDFDEEAFLKRMNELMSRQ